MELLGLWLWYLLPANPLLVRIVQGGSRRTRHLWIRMGYLGVLVLVVVTRVLAGGVSLGGPVSLTELAKAGQSVFQWVAYGQVILICLLAPLFMAGAISAEQSGKTFNILLTTPLTNLQIVLGSLLGRLFFVLALLASGLPLFAILQIFGGVRMSSVLVSFGVAALSAVMVGSVAVTLAVLRIGGRKAVFIFVVVVAAYLVGAYAADHLLRGALRIGPGLTTWITPLHPLLVLESNISPDYIAPSAEAVAGYPQLARLYLSNPFGAFAAITLGLSLLLIAWSALRVRAVGQGVEGGGGFWWGRLRRGRGDGERKRKPREVWGNPIAWRESHTRGSGGMGVMARWGFAVAALAAAGLDLLYYHMGKINSDDFTYVLIVLLLVELAVVVLVAIYMSAGSISREREDRSLDLLLATPVTPRQYLWGKLRGLVSFLSLLLAVPVLTLAMLAVYTQVGLQLGWKQVNVAHPIPGATGSIIYPLCIPEAPLLLALVLVPFVAMCVAVGMSQSIKAKGVLTAVAYSVGFLGLYVACAGFFGYEAATNWPLIGPVFNAFSPATGFLMFLNPTEDVAGFINEPVAGRISLVIAALIAAAGFSVVVYSMFWSMVQGFDQTVRKISGAA